MSAPFKPGDKVTLLATVVTADDSRLFLKLREHNCTWMSVSDATPFTPPPAPKAEREAVPEDARVGDVYESETCSYRVRVSQVLSTGAYYIRSVNFCGEARNAKGEHRARGWHLISRGQGESHNHGGNCSLEIEGGNCGFHGEPRGKCSKCAPCEKCPAPVPTPEAKREWRVGQRVFITKSRNWRGVIASVDGSYAKVTFDNEAGKTVYPVAELSHEEPAPTPEPAKVEVTRETVAAIFNEPPEPATPCQACNGGGGDASGDCPRCAGCGVAATGMTAGERLYKSHFAAFPHPAPWCAISDEERVRWEHTARAFLSAGSTQSAADKVALWDAVNAYAKACGGDPSKRVYGNVARQRAVVAVESAALAAQPASGERVTTEFFLIRDKDDTRETPYWGAIFASTLPCSGDAFRTREARDERLRVLRAANPGNAFVPVRLTRSRKVKP